MTAKSHTDHQTFRFHTGKGKSLTDEIAELEALATKSLRTGVSFHSVQTGAIALLRMLLHEAAGQLAAPAPSVPACPPPPDQSRCAGSTM